MTKYANRHYWHMQIHLEISSAHHIYQTVTKHKRNHISARLTCQRLPETLRCIPKQITLFYHSNAFNLDIHVSVFGSRVQVPIFSQLKKTNIETKLNNNNKNSLTNQLTTNRGMSNRLTCKLHLHFYSLHTDLRNGTLVFQRTL